MAVEITFFDPFDKFFASSGAVAHQFDEFLWMGQEDEVCMYVTAQKWLQSLAWILH